jgi:DNA primase
LWRLSPTPVLCFDGDAAGARAAARAAELALPLLAPDRGLRLATSPAGHDPDTLIRSEGARGFRSVLDAARPFAESLFELLREQVGGKTEEQRALLSKRLEETASKIADRALGWEYRQAFRERFNATFRIRRRSGPAFRAAPATPRPRLTDDAASDERSRILLAVLLRHPALLRDVGHALAELDLCEAWRGLRDALLAWSDHADVLDSGGLMNHLTTSGFAAAAAQALATVPVPLPGFASAEAMPGDAEAGWWHIFGLMHRSRLEEEVAIAKRAFERSPEPEQQLRLTALRRALIALETGEQGGPEA